MTVSGIKVNHVAKDFLKAYPDMRLTGNNHVSRVMILPGLAQHIPQGAKESLYYKGQGRMPIISLMLAQLIAEALNVEESFFSVEV